MSEAHPDLTVLLRAQLATLGEFDLAAQVETLRIVSPCTCALEGCASFWAMPIDPTGPRPEGQYRMLGFNAAGVLACVDVLDGQVAHVELYREAPEAP